MILSAMFPAPKRLWIVAGLLAFTLAAAMLLPNAGPMRPSRLSQHLPEQCGGWTGKPIPVSERELSVLAKDTVFVRSQFTRDESDALPAIEASLVFSGKDMNNSIHRPENCLRAQGWTFVRERYLNLGPIIPGEPGFGVREILCSKVRRDPETQKPVTLPNGKHFHDWQLLYYTFIGANEITPSHYGRAFRDIRDRITGGYDQQWAYATFSTIIPAKYAEQGIDIRELQPLDDGESGELLAGFMRQILPPLMRKPGTPEPSTTHPAGPQT